MNKVDLNKFTDSWDTSNIPELKYKVIELKPHPKPYTMNRKQYWYNKKLTK